MADDAALPPLPLGGDERIDEVLAAWARERGTEEALIFGERRIDYATFARLVDEMAKAMLAAGVAHGDRVAVHGKPRPEYFILFLAAASIGAIYVGLNAKYRLGELRYIVGDAEPSLLVAITDLDDERVALLRGVVARDDAWTPPPMRLVSRDRARELDADSLEHFATTGATVSDATLAAARARVSAGDVCAIVYTSGSTGQPKGAMLTHRGMVVGGRIAYEQWADPQPRIVCDLPINHVGCLHDICCSMLVAGGALVFREDFDPGGVLELLGRERLTLWGGVPTMFLMQRELPEFETADYSSVKSVIWSGAAMPLPLLRELRRVAPHARFRNFYSSTETTVGITFTDPDADDETLALTVGRPDARIDFRIVDLNDEIAPAGESGEIQVRSPGMFVGYWRRPEATRAVITDDGWYRTGDVGVALGDGNVRLVGRVREMFKSGGYNVYPAEIEAAIETFPGVAMAAVVATSDLRFQEVGFAFLVAAPGVILDVDALRAFCRDTLANYKVPKRFSVEPELPMLPIGKVDKGRLRQVAASRVDAESRSTNHVIG